MVWFTSDWHLGHDNVLDFCQRPFANVTDMHTALITNYRKRVQPEDTVYFVGDISFTDFETTKELFTWLPGTKILVQGNHDKFSQAQYLRIGFAAVYEEIMIRLFGRRIRLSHYPHRPGLISRIFNKKARDLRYRDRRPLKDGRWLIHGHTHTTMQSNPKYKEIHVGVDAWNFGPVSQREVESLIAKAEG